MVSCDIHTAPDRGVLRIDVLFADFPLLGRLLEGILPLALVDHLLGLLEPLVLLLEPSYLPLHPLLGGLHLAVPPVELLFKLRNHLLLPVHLVLDT
jgi:hypothetical protein